MKRIIVMVLLSGLFGQCYATSKNKQEDPKSGRRIQKQNRVSKIKENRLNKKEDSGRGIKKQNRMATTSDLSPNELKQRLEKTYPQLSIDNVEKSPLPGFYELTAGPSVWYVSADGRFVLTGDVWDIESASPADQNLTERVRRDLRVKLVSDLQDKNMIVYKPKSERVAVVTVLTDPDCGYCKRLHSELPRLAELGVELRYIAFPRQGISSPTYTKMVGVWCSDNQHLAMSKAMSGEVIEADACEHPLEEQLKIAEQLGVNATPALVFEDGTLVLGYMPAEQLAEKAKQHHIK